MFRKVFLFVCLIAFCLGAVLGCAKPASQSPTVDSKTTEADANQLQQATPAVTE